MNRHDDMSSRNEASVIAGSVNRTRVLVARTTGFTFIGLKRVYTANQMFIWLVNRPIRVYSP